MWRNWLGIAVAVCVCARPVMAQTVGSIIPAGTYQLARVDTTGVLPFRFDSAGTQGASILAGELVLDPSLAYTIRLSLEARQGGEVVRRDAREHRGTIAMVRHPAPRPPSFFANTPVGAKPLRVRPDSIEVPDSGHAMLFVRVPAAIRVQKEP